jgi:RNA polymerase sigma-70 factor (ECF subfamily)
VVEFDRLYTDNSDSVFRYAWLLTGDPVAAEDVTSEVFLRAWVKRHTFRGDGAPLSWLLAITHNCARTIQRAASRETVDMEALDRIPDDDGEEPETRALAALEMTRLRDAIALLTPDQQQVIVLRFFEGLSHDQVAAHVCSTPNAVRALQFRAIRRLRAILDGDGGDDE